MIEFLTLVAVWCGDLATTPEVRREVVQRCRKELIECADKLKGERVDIVARKCIIEKGRK